ncbi:glycosyltransferase family 2 protein [Salidesulfovibrio brasiliensis]|uniref:glycosyltransferase family 2 protein n=1 Tax=Salidesulfovibrio brasiliensis TaxID=221711 RepID=UPI000B2AC663|nr:glycosyltransferase family 2 protein [Salidesulfovibrio brasiliensis]
MRDIEVSIVTPMHNEELCIEEFHRRISAAMQGAGYEHEIILVNDGSTDRTEQLMRQISTVDPNVRCVCLSRNRGQCTAIYAGLQHSRGRYVVIMDGDLQHKPEEVPSLVEEIRKGWDLVSGMRQKRSESKWLRLVPSKIANWMIRSASGCEIHDMGGLSCLKGDIARSLQLREGHHRIIPALVYRLGGSVTEVPTSAPPRFAGKSHYGLSRSIDVLFDIVTLWFQNAFKQRPVYLFGRIALGFFITASLLSAWVLFEKVFFGVHMGTRPPFLAAILFYITSLGFMSTGFILEALGDTMDSVMQTRPYMVREIISQEETQSGKSPESS